MISFHRGSGVLLLAILTVPALGGCMLPAYRFATPACRAGKRRGGRLAMLPADITVFTSRGKRRAMKDAGLPGGVVAVVNGLRGKGHRVVASVDVGGRVTGVGRGYAGRKLHPEDIRNLRIALYHQAELMVDRRGSGNGAQYVVDRKLVNAVARASGADALLYLYVTAYSKPPRRVSAGEVALAVGEYLAAIGVTVAVGALVGGTSVQLKPTSISVGWSSRNLNGKRINVTAGPSLPGAHGVVGPILIAQTTTPVMEPVPCQSCPRAAPAAGSAGDADPESREPTFVGRTRRVESSVIEATLVAVSARDGQLLWVSRWFHKGDIAEKKTNRLLFEHIVEEAPSCGMKLWDWSNFRE